MDSYEIVFRLFCVFASNPTGSSTSSAPAPEPDWLESHDGIRAIRHARSFPRSTQLVKLAKSRDLRLGDPPIKTTSPTCSPRRRTRALPDRQGRIRGSP